MDKLARMREQVLEDLREARNWLSCENEEKADETLWRLQRKLQERPDWILPKLSKLDASAKDDDDDDDDDHAYAPDDSDDEDWDGSERPCTRQKVTVSESSSS